MRTLFISLLGLSLAAVGWAAPVTITSYDIVDAVQSGHGSWSHTYGGTIVPGASFSNSGYGGTLATYSGGTGTLADGILGTATGNTQLFVQGPASDGTSINPVITIYLSGIFSINSISIFGGPDENSIPGYINGVTVGLGGSSAALATTQFGSGGGCGLVNDLLTIGGSSLDGLTTNVITLSNCNFFSISEIQIDGDEASAVPEPGSVMLLITGLVGLGIVRRRRLS